MANVRRAKNHATVAADKVHALGLFMDRDSWPDAAAKDKNQKPSVQTLSTETLANSPVINSLYTEI